MTVIYCNLERENYKALQFQMNFKFHTYFIHMKFNVIDTLVNHFRAVADAFCAVRILYYKHNWTTDRWFLSEALLLTEALLVVKPENFCFQIVMCTYFDNTTNMYKTMKTEPSQWTALSNYVLYLKDVYWLYHMLYGWTWPAKSRVTTWSLLV